MESISPPVMLVGVQQDLHIYQYHQHTSSASILSTLKYGWYETEFDHGPSHVYNGEV